MPEKIRIDWTVNFQVGGGPNVSESDFLTCDAYDKIEVVVEAGSEKEFISNDRVLPVENGLPGKIFLDTNRRNRISHCLSGARHFDYSAVRRQGMDQESATDSTLYTSAAPAELLRLIRISSSAPHRGVLQESPILGLPL